MNWYSMSKMKMPLEEAIARLNPVKSLSSVRRIAWIDPRGTIYCADNFDIHDDWIADNLSILNEIYNWGIEASHVSDGDEEYCILGMKDYLIREGWIRFTRGIGGADSYVFEIATFNDALILRRIENLLFDAIGYGDDATIKIASLDSIPLIHFKWQDFISSGESFVDYVKNSISNLRKKWY